MSSLINAGRPFVIHDHRDAGLTRRDLLDGARTGVLRRIIDRVYVDGRAADTRQLRLEALMLVAPQHATLADEWAAWLYGVDAFTPTERHRMVPTVLVPHGTSRPRVPGVRCRQAVVDPVDLLELEGVCVTTPARTTSDLLRKRWRPYALSAGDAMVRAGVVTIDEVEAHVAALKGYPGIRQARVLASMLDPLAESAGESWMRLRMVDAGFPRPVLQWVVVDAEGIERRLDAGYPDRAVAAEYDGAADHTSDDDAAHDAHRRAMVEAVGPRIVVARRPDIFGPDQSFERRLGELLGIEPLSRRWGATEFRAAA